MRRALLAALALLLALPVLGLAALWLLFDADSLRPRIEAEVERATGRALTVERLSLAPGLAPALEARGVALANAAGLEGQMFTARRAEVSLALLPLLAGRVELRRLEAEGVELRLERGNWNLAPRPGAAPRDAAPAAPAASGRTVTLGEVVLRDVLLRAGGEEIRIPRASLSATGALAATVALRGEEVGVTGRIAGLGDGPFSLRAALPGGASLAAEGERRGGAVSARVEAQAPSLIALSALAGVPLPALGDVSARAELAAGAGPLRIGALELRAGGGELGGLRVAEARLAAPSGDAPLSLVARGGWGGRPIALSGTLPSLAALLDAGVALPVALRAELPGGEASLAGPLPLPGRPAAAPLVLEARLDELAALAPGLPAVTALRLSAQVRPEGEAWRISDLSLDSSAGDLAGDLLLRAAPRPGVSGRVESRRLDLDAWRPPPEPGASTPPPAPPSAPAGPPRAILDRPLPFAALRGFDADLAFAAGELRAGGVALREVAGRLRNEAGRARLDPIALTLPGGRLELRIAADATLDPPALQVAGGGAGLDLAALLPALDLAGRADLRLDLRGAGEGTRALAATLTGQLGLAVVEGRVGARLTRGLLAGLPGAPGGSLALDCLALRVEADRGVARPRVLLLETPLGRIAAEGAASLRDETLALRLLADLRIAGVRVRAPVPLTGSFLDPALDWRGVADSALAGDLGQQAERLLPGLGSALGQAARPRGAAMSSLPECGPALREARFGRDGAVPAPRRPEEPRAQASPAPSLDGLLRDLLRR